MASLPHSALPDPALPADVAAAVASALGERWSCDADPRSGAWWFWRCRLDRWGEPVDGDAPSLLVFPDGAAGVLRAPGWRHRLWLEGGRRYRLPEEAGRLAEMAERAARTGERQAADAAGRTA